MGVWDFVKEAGKSIFGAAEASEAPREAALKKEMKDLGLDTSGLDFKVDGDKVKVSGKALNQEMKEKIIMAAGNVSGVAKVEDDIPGDDPTFYTVQKGDTLSGIAKKTLGNANDYMKIFEANKPMLSDPDKIYPGQNLRIPK